MCSISGTNIIGIMHSFCWFIDLSMSSTRSLPRTITFLLLLVVLPFLLLSVFVCPVVSFAEPGNSQPLSPYSFLSGGGDFDDFQLYKRPYKSEQDSYSTPFHNDENDLYSGPAFTVEPEQGGRNPLEYSNVTSVPITCKVYGYPTPRIEWRVDNITIGGFVSSSSSSVHEFDSSAAKHQLYSPQVNAFVSLRNDGQTLLIGGHSNLSSIAQSYSSSNYHNHNLFGPSGSSSSLHQIECLATNQFGSIISRPVYVQQVLTSNGEYGSVPVPNHQFGLYGPRQSSVPSMSVQLYDEFVSRGNVAVLKCLVLNVATTTTTNVIGSSLSNPSNVQSDGPSSAKLSSSYPSNAYHYNHYQGPVIQSNHHHYSSGSSSSASTNIENVAHEFIFEWRIKNGPAASASTGETILTLRSNQTQGKYTAYPTGELHVREVDEHDARRTYQCVIYPRSGSTRSAQPLSTTFGTFSPTGYGRKFGNSVSSSGSSSPANELHYQQHNSPNSAKFNDDWKLQQQQPQNFLPIESTFAQIILSGSEKDVFPPRIVHRLVGTSSSSTTASATGSAELFAENGQLDSILIPCAAQAQPLPTYRWFWIPLASNSAFDWEAELSALALHQSSSGSGPSSLPHPFAMPIPAQSSSVSTGSNTAADRRQQMSLSRIRTFGGGSTLQIPGPISQIDSGHYVALVQNTIGYDRCTTSLYVRSPLSIQMEWSSSTSSGSSPSLPPSPKSTGSSNRSRVIRVIRGETVQLRCIVNGFPVSELYWLHNAVPLTVASSPSVSSNEAQQSSSGSSLPQSDMSNSASSGSATTTTSRTVELHLDEQHKSGMYQCFARNRFQVVQTSVQIAVIDQPPSMVEQFNEITVQPGDFVSLRCTSLASPLAQIYWSIDGQSVPNSSRFRFGDFVTATSQTKSTGQPSSSSRLVSHFNITSVRVEDGGLYMCTAKNIAGMVSHQARLNVHGKASVKMHTPNVTALSNSDIELNCPFYGFPIKSITWFGRDGSSRKLPINGRQHISPNGTLHITKVNKKEDEGSYECEIQQESGLTARTKIHLKVITGPRIDNFSFASNLEEGMRSVAICAVIAGDSPIRISWLKDGVQLLSNVVDASPSLDYKIEMVNEFTSSITFMALKRKHAGRYTCIASNPASSDQHSTDLKVNVAPIWLMEPRDIVAISGQRLIIDCQAEGIPEPQIRWKMESFDGSGLTSSPGNELANERIFNSKKMNTNSGSSGSGNSNTFHAVISNPHIQILENGSLFIKEVQRDDHRRYMCSAFNSVGSGISTIIRLSVNFPPQFIYGYFESKTIKVGESIVLTCLVKVEHIEPVLKNTTNGSAGSGSISGSSNSLMMEMRWYKLDGKPNPIGTHAEVDRHLHDRFHITSTFELTNPGSLLNNSASSLTTNDHTLYYVTKLTIRQVERADSGSYLCTAQNHYGFVRKNFTLTVLEVPDKPLEMRSDAVTSTTMKISWLAPFDGNSAITEYVISYRALTATIPVTVSVSAFYSGPESSGPRGATTGLIGSKKWITYQLIDLVPFTAYAIQIKAKNTIGYSAFSESINVKTAEEPPSEIPSDVTILPLNTKSLKISWHRPRYSSSKNLKSKGGYVPPITGYYIGYRPNLEQMPPEQAKLDSNNEFVFKTVKAANTMTDSDTETFVLSNLQRATRYDIKIQAFNLAGAGPSTSELLGKTLDFDVPSAPRIRALKSNLSSIELVWSVQGEEPIAGFVISYKPASANELSSSANEMSSMSSHDDSADEWKTIKLEVERDANVPGSGQDLKANGPTAFYEEKRVLYEGSTVFHRRTYVLAGLRCGTKYFIYVNAYNQVGQGDPSEVILSRTEGNVPIAPESTDDFLSSNITYVRLNLNQWKKLGCPIELFEIDYRLYGDSSSTQKVTYRPDIVSSLSDHSKFGHHQMIKKDGLADVSFDNETFASMFNYEVFNLNPGSWYELIIRAQTEAGYVAREYLFATLKLDGSTVAPLTLKAIDGNSGRASDGSGGTFLSIRSTLFAQLHYIVPVSCTLFILFLVTVVVCAIHTTHQQRQLHPQDPNHHHFLLSFMSNRNRSDKVSGGKTICSNSSTSNSGHYTSSSGGTTTAGSCVGDHPGSLMMMLHDSSGNPLTDLQGDFCGGKLSDDRYGKPMMNGGGVAHRTDSCHSLGGCGGMHDLGPGTTVHMDTIKMMKSCDNNSGAPLPLPPTSKSNSSYPLYNLPVPYATSAVQQFNSQKGQDSKPGQDIYGTAGTCIYTKGQLSEMYCDNTANNTSVNLVLLDQTNSQANYSQQRVALTNSNVGPMDSNVPGMRGPSGHHQYELPFVFKNVPINHNESTAF